MRLSFEDEESFKEAVESLRFNNPPSDPNAHQQIGSGSSLSIQETRRNGDVQVSFNNPPSDPECTGAVTLANGMPV